MIQSFSTLRRFIATEPNTPPDSMRHSRVPSKDSGMSRRSQRSASNPSPYETYSNPHSRSSSSHQQSSEPWYMNGRFKSIRYNTAGQVLKPGESTNTVNTAGAQDDSTNYPLPSIPFTAPRAAPPVPLPTARTRLPERSRTRLQKKTAQRPSTYGEKRRSSPYGTNDGFDGVQEMAAPMPQSPFGKPETPAIVRSETESEIYQDVVLIVPHRLTADGLDTPRRSEWSADSDEEARSLRHAARALPVNGGRAGRSRRKMWYFVIAVMIGILLAAAVVVGAVLGVKKSQSQDGRSTDSQTLGSQADQDSSAFSATTASNIGLANWGWDDGGMSLFTIENNEVRMATRLAGTSAWAMSPQLAGNVKDGALRLAVSRKAEFASRWSLFYVDDTNDILTSVTLDIMDSTQDVERQALERSTKWTPGSLGSLAIVMSNTNTHFQTCGNDNVALDTTNPTGPGDMAAMFRQESGELRMVKYRRGEDVWAFEDLLPEMATTDGPATCVYDEEYLHVWILTANSTVQEYIRPLNERWEQGWITSYAVEVDQMLPGGDFHAVHAENYTTLIYQDADLDVRQLTLTHGDSVQTTATTILGPANNKTRVAGARADDGLRIFWQEDANIMEEDLRAEVDFVSGQVIMVEDGPEAYTNNGTSAAAKQAVSAPTLALVAALAYIFIAI